MSKLSFVIFCIENYADSIGVSSDKVYKLFRNEGLIDLLRSDYDDLHGMGMEYMVNFCKEYLGEKSLENLNLMVHGTVRATILPEIIKMICKKFDWDEEKALDKFYTSATGENFSDDETGFYGQSALYIYSQFCEEFCGQNYL